MKHIKTILLIIALIAVIGLAIYGYIVLNREEEQNGGEYGTERALRPAEEFTLEDLLGTEISLSDFRGRKVYLNFWATWCRACNVMTPYINEVYLEGHDIEILAINIRENNRAIENYMETNNFEFTVLLDSNGRVSNRYRAAAVPHSVLIDEEGNIIDTHTGAMNKQQLMEFMRLR